jgi:hypothetical protein
MSDRDQFARSPQDGEKEAGTTGTAQKADRAVSEGHKSYRERSRDPGHMHPQTYIGG